MPRRDPGLASQHTPPPGSESSEMAVWPSTFQSTESRPLGVLGKGSSGLQKRLR